MVMGISGTWKLRASCYFDMHMGEDMIEWRGDRNTVWETKSICPDGTDKVFSSTHPPCNKATTAAGKKK